MRQKRRFKCFGFCVIIMLFIQSCDSGLILPLDNNKFSYDFALSESNIVKTSCMYFKGSHYLLFDLKGKYVINPDSLKLKICDDNIKFLKSIPCSGTDSYNKNNMRIKNRVLSVRLRYERKDKSKEIKEPLVLIVLPSDFIMQNDKCVLTDSLRFVLIRPKRAKSKSN